MTDTLKVLGQAAPAAATLTTLYTVPAATQVVISSIVVCNQNSGGSIKFRISIAVGGAADSPLQYLYFDATLTGNNSFTLVIGITLTATDQVRVQTNTANVSFNLFGDQVT